MERSGPKNLGSAEEIFLSSATNDTGLVTASVSEAVSDDAVGTASSLTLLAVTGLSVIFHRVASRAMERSEGHNI